jgi:hypothetical protein
MDPNLYKSPGLLLAAIRYAIEPTLLPIGFRYAGRSGSIPRLQHIDFTRPSDLLSITWEHSVGVTADHLSECGSSLQQIAFADLRLPISDLHPATRTSAAIDARLAPFNVTVKRYFESFATGSANAPA